MTALTRLRAINSCANSQPKTTRLLVALAGLATTAALAGPPAHADTATDIFLRALENAGVPYDNPEGATALADTICPMLVRPGADLAAVAARIDGDSMSPEMARLFATIAIKLYCPQLISDLTTDRTRGSDSAPRSSNLPLGDLFGIGGSDSAPPSSSPPASQGSLLPLGDLFGIGGPDNPPPTSTAPASQGSLLPLGELFGIGNLAK